MRPLVLDLDGAVGPLPGECRVELGGWQERLRFGCRRAALAAFDAQALGPVGAQAAAGPVFYGSGDFHHVSLPLIARRLAAAGVRARSARVVVLDNHPDNMRYPFGIHCGSWVRAIALRPAVGAVHVVGITSADVAARHAWEHYRAPLTRGGLHYWCIGVDTGWAAQRGLSSRIRSFPDVAAMLAALSPVLYTPAPTYVSIDKDVFSPAVARTNWDQGVMTPDQAVDVLECIRGPWLGADVTGGVSQHRYRSPFKRWLSALDAQPPVDGAALQDWQAQQHALDQRLMTVLAARLSQTTASAS